MGVTSTGTRRRASGDTSGPRGRRVERRVAQRRRQLRRRLGLGLAGLAVALVAGTVTALLVSLTADPEPAPRGGVGDTVGPPQQTLLLVRHAEQGGPATSVTLLAAGVEETRGTVLFLPVGTLVDIPGVGLDRLGLAHQYGGVDLVHSAVEHLLGVRVDHVAAVTDAGLGAWLDRIGGLEVDVAARLVRRRQDGSADVRFEPGPQRLDGARIAELFGFRVRGEDELDGFPRQQRVLGALLAAAGDEGARAALLEGGAPQLRTGAEPDWLDDLLTRLAAARAEGQVRFSVLPVEPFGGDGPDGGATYRLREADARELVETHLAGSVPIGGGPQAIRVQVLNGVGVPGIGQAVDERLERGTFRIVLSDNARSFDFETTQIVVYDETERSLGAARRVQELLGIGTITVSRQPQSVVDLTIVVGADFVEEGEAGQDDPDG